MKTILWATMTANGNYAQHPPKKEALSDFAMKAKSVGNFIVGRRTFEKMRGSQGDNAGPFADIDIVVLSKYIKEIPGVKVVESPKEALDYLQKKGHKTALLSGGAELHNTFLSQRLVDEIIFNVAPVLEGKGLNVLLDTNYRYEDIQLLDFNSLGSGVIQLHYAV